MVPVTGFVLFFSGANLYPRDISPTSHPDISEATAAKLSTGPLKAFPERCFKKLQKEFQPSIPGIAPEIASTATYWKTILKLRLAQPRQRITLASMLIRGI